MSSALIRPVSDVIDVDAFLGEQGCQLAQHLVGHAGLELDPRRARRRLGVASAHLCQGTRHHAHTGLKARQGRLSQYEDHWDGGDGNGSAYGPQVLWFQPDRGEGHDLTAADCRALAASFTASAVLLELAEAIDGSA